MPARRSPSQETGLVWRLVKRSELFRIASSPGSAYAAWMHHLSVTNLPLLLAIATLWLLGLNVNLSAPITGAKIVTAILFILVLIWFIVSAIGLAH